MTKEEFLEIQSEVLSGEKLLKSILVAHGVPYSTYNYWRNKITSNDLSILTNGASNSVSDSWVNGKKVVESDITCKNGYLHKVDGVMVQSDNMAQIINRHANMSIFARMMNRFSAPYYDDAATKEYNRLYNNTDSVFTLKYGSIIIMPRMTYAEALPLYGLRQNIYTDPQKPMKVAPGIYPMNGAGPQAACPEFRPS